MRCRLREQSKLKLTSSLLGAARSRCAPAPRCPDARDAGSRNAEACGPGPGPAARDPPAAQTPAPAPTPPKPFPEGAKIAYVNVQAIASNSVEGKAATSKLDDLRKKKTAEIAEKNKAARRRRRPSSSRAARS